MTGDSFLAQRYSTAWAGAVPPGISGTVPGFGSQPRRELALCRTRSGQLMAMRANLSMKRINSTRNAAQTPPMNRPHSGWIYPPSKERTML